MSNMSFESQIIFTPTENIDDKLFGEMSSFIMQTKCNVSSCSEINAKDIV